MDFSIMKSKFIALLFLVLFVKTHAQVAENVQIQCQILDSITKEPLPYAQVLVVEQQKGTITNTDGYFKIYSIPSNTLLRISFIGYKTHYISASKASRTSTIYLKPKTELLNAVTIVGDASFLYSLIAKSKKTQSNKVASARSYLELETEINHQPIELLEGYYTGDYLGYDIKDLHLKNGRVFIKQLDSSYYLSTETTKAIYSHNQFKKTPYFPKSPFELTENKLRKAYSLKLVKRYLDEDKKLVYVIYFKPRKNASEYFEGTVWMDSASTHLKKIELEINNASRYPLKPIHSKDSIQRMDLKIRKNFIQIHGESYVKSLDFEYQLEYKRSQSEAFTVSSKAVVFAYNFDSLFVLPKFNFPDILYQDYHHIFSVPYNAFFWENVSDFDYKYQTDFRASFTNDETLLSNKFTDTLQRKLINFQHIPWSLQRVDIHSVRQTRDDALNDINTYKADMYHFEIQHYLDYNRFNGVLNYVSAVILDPVESFYTLPISASSNAFVNIYFDCMEIEHRMMRKKLDVCKNENELERVYAEELERIKAVSQTILTDLKHGLNKDAMLFYNHYVLENLGIDNVDFFDVYEN